ncbi:ATP synthase F1 subunit gamma [Hornefia porci]|uniref:ATP synthase gamma chain n=1 Tax=Hornefia porci TaxID=2652292 RepID=A0A1Q9JIQ1_9FIRM|nr:ATP synthase F1 subunit gamma [Hornefia porci]OLR56088.1 ATP synthase F1 subunit gamma [Hornefia porci]
MAEQMQDIKRRIKSINSTERITNAMKLVSAAKLRRAKAIYEHSKLYLDRIIESIDEAFDNGQKVPKELILGSREMKTSCYVIITSSTGLCGSFNGNVIREAEATIRRKGREAVLVDIGSKGREYFERRGYDVIIEHDPPADTVDYEEVKKLVRPLFEKYMSGEIDEIVLVYTSYVNTLKQEVVRKRILPVDISKRSVKSSNINVIEYEPSVNEVFRYLVSKYMEMTLYSAVIESATCEHAARRQAMENANDNASDMLKLLMTEYNRARQSQITNEIIEIVSGSEALN